MKPVRLGRTGIEASPVVYGGIVSMDDGQAASDRYVNWAMEQGINYYDVAPSYGDAQEKLGNSLKPYRKDVYLACKTAQRKSADAVKEFEESTQLLHTDYFDVYQLHALTTDEDIDVAFGPGGVMELMRRLKEEGRVRNLGFSAHSEVAALRALELYDFDTVLFPFNWFMMLERGFGARLLEVAKQRDMGILCLKPLIERKWKDEEERKASAFPKSWCKPIDVEDTEFGVAAMKYALSLGVHTLVPPGNFPSFRFTVDNIEKCMKNSLTEADLQFLHRKLEEVRGMEFFNT